MSFQRIGYVILVARISRKANRPINICHVLLIHLFHLLTNIRNAQNIRKWSASRAIKLKIGLYFMSPTFCVLHTAILWAMKYKNRFQTINNNKLVHNGQWTINVLGICFNGDSDIAIYNSIVSRYQQFQQLLY